MATSHVGLHPSFAVLPLLSSTLTVFFAVVETTIMFPFLRAAEVDARAAGKIARLWFENWLTAGLCTIFAVVLPGVILGAYGAYHSPPDSLEWKLYTAGATFAAAHFVAVPTMNGVINNLCDPEVEKKGETIANVRQWLNVHFYRTFLTDLPAMACFIWLTLRM